MAVVETPGERELPELYRPLDEDDEVVARTPTGNCWHYLDSDGGAYCATTADVTVYRPLSFAREHTLRHVCNACRDERR